jgi:hypothetical protein
LEINKQRRVKIKLPFISSPQAVRADPTSMSHPSMDEPNLVEKKNLPIDNIGQRNLLFIADQKENMYIYLQQQFK